MPLGQLPSNLEKVAEAGGWDARAAQQAKEFVKEISKIKPAQWKGINENLTILKGFIDKSAGNVISILKDDITQAVTLKFGEALAPLKNEIYGIVNNVINEALGPIMPYINVGVEWLGVGIDLVMDGLFNVGVFIGTQLQQWAYMLDPSLTPEAKAAEAERIAKERRARYQFTNQPGSGGRVSGLQEGSGTMGSAPSPPSSTTSKTQEY